MARVTLYFQPFPDDDAVSLRVEEAPASTGPWTEIENEASIGTFPDWISALTTENATAESYWFRIRWERDTGAFTPYSEPVLGTDIPERWTVPTVYRDWTRLDTDSLNDVQLQSLIDRAYFRLLEECGPYDLTDPAFPERAQLAIHLMVDRLLLVSDPEAQKVILGYLEEQKGSYRYRRSDKALDYLSTVMDSVPNEISSLICPFSIDPIGAVEMITTHVFTQAQNYIERDSHREYVYTGGDRWEFTPDVWGIYGRSRAVGIL